MKILVITPRIPFPPFRGDKLRIYNIIKILSIKNEVKVVSFIKDPNELTSMEDYKKEGINIEVVNLSKLRSMINLIRSFILSEPLQVSYYYSKKMHQKIFEMTSKEEFDVIYFHIFTTAQYHKAVSNSTTLKVIDLTDATSLYLTRYMEFLKNPLKKLYFDYERRKIINYEKIIQKFDTVFVCSPVDRDYLLKRGVHNNIQLFINGINNEIYKYESSKPEKFRIIFTGNMPYFPNKDAVIYFAKEIFPLILNKIPKAIFYIVGQDPSDEILALQSENIIVTGFVSDMKREYILSEVNVAPVRFGAGTPNKITEALALGIPTVATSLTISGFSDEIKKFILTADTPEMFADKVITIFNDETIRTEYMKEASDAVGKLLNWKNLVGTIDNYLINRIGIKRKQ
ncbi:MAG: glycosyltransferase [Melioribacter sp.]|nr:glycosyltransferase [Melioribacter sp.]